MRTYTQKSQQPYTLEQANHHVHEQFSHIRLFTFLHLHNVYNVNRANKEYWMHTVCNYFNIDVWSGFLHEPFLYPLYYKTIQPKLQPTRRQHAEALRYLGFPVPKIAEILKTSEHNVRYEFKKKDFSQPYYNRIYAAIHNNIHDLYTIQNSVFTLREAYIDMLIKGMIDETVLDDQNSYL